MDKNSEPQTLDLQILDFVTGEFRLFDIDPSMSVDAPMVRTAGPDAVYSFVDGRGHNTAVDGLAVVRHGDALVMTVDGEPVVRIEGFFAEGASARFRVVDESVPSGLWTVDSREAAAYADEEDDDEAGAVLWPLQNAPATLVAEKELVETLGNGGDAADPARTAGQDASGRTATAGAAATDADVANASEAPAELSSAAKIGIGAGIGLGAIAVASGGGGGGGGPADGASGSGAPRIGGGERATGHAIVEGVRTVVDLDADEPVTWSIVAGELDAAEFDIDADGVLGFLVPPDVDSGGDGFDAHAVRVQATDADGNTAFQRIDVRVFDRSIGDGDGDGAGDGNGDGPDAIGPDGDGAEPGGSGSEESRETLQVLENTIHVPLAGSSFDTFGEDAPEIVGGADAALFTVDEEWRLVFREAPDFESPRDADGDNGYELRLSVFDDRPRDVVVRVQDEPDTPPPPQSEDNSGAGDLWMDLGYAVPVQSVESWWGE